jgi:hypothetical protein
MSKIEDSLRELVREELDGRKPPPPPDRKLFFWLFLCVTNVAMLIWLLPETVLDSKRVEAATKFIIWLGGSIFVSCFVWFRDQLLGLAQKPFFKRMQIAAFPVLILLYLSQLNIFTIHPVIEPSDAELILNGQSVSEDEREDLSLSLNKQKIIVQPAGWKPQDDLSAYPRPRKFMLTKSDVLYYAWLGREQPRWPLIYNVYIKASGSVDQVVVQRREGDFDSGFVKEPEPALSDGLTLDTPAATGRELVYQWRKMKDIILPLRLPYGKYTVFTRKEGCAEKFTADIDVPAVKNTRTELREPCPP